MKLIVLAAGKGTRLKPITNTVPKPLIKIFGKTIIEHNLENIYKNIDEIIIIVKYLKEKIIKELGDNYKGTKITYYEQSNEKGTAAAIKGLNLNSKKIIIINGDSIFNKKDLKLIIKSKNYGALIKKVENPSIYGIFKEKNGYANEIIEKPNKMVGNLASVGVYKFSSEIFNLVEKLSLSTRGEYELTDAINLFIKNNKFKLFPISGKFIDIGYPWDILSSNKYFLNKLEKSIIKGVIEEGVIIKGNIVLEKGAILKSGTYIEGNCYIGKNTSIGPNAYLRGSTVIGEGCKIGNAVEIKNSTLGKNTNSAHLSYIGDSIIGNNVNLAGGFISANLRHNNDYIKVMIKGKLINSKLRKLGCIIGDNVKTGMNTSTYPGRILENNTYTIPGEIIK